MPGNFKIDAANSEINRLIVEDFGRGSKPKASTALKPFTAPAVSASVTPAQYKATLAKPHEEVARAEIKEGKEDTRTIDELICAKPRAPIGGK